MTENRCRIVVRKVRIEHPCGVFMNGIKEPSYSENQHPRNSL